MCSRWLLSWTGTLTWRCCSPASRSFAPTCTRSAGPPARTPSQACCSTPRVVGAPFPTCCIAVAVQHLTISSSMELVMLSLKAVQLQLSRVTKVVASCELTTA